MGALSGRNALRVLGEAERCSREISLTRRPSLARIEELDGAARSGDRAGPRVTAGRASR